MGTPEKSRQHRAARGTDPRCREKEYNTKEHKHDLGHTATEPLNFPGNFQLGSWGTFPESGRCCDMMDIEEEQYELPDGIVNGYDGTKLSDDGNRKNGQDKLRCGRADCLYGFAFLQANVVSYLC